MRRSLGNVGLIGLTVCLLAVACTQRREIAGRDIDPKTVDQIVVGTTTKQEVTDRFGKPDQVNNKSGEEEYIYTYRGVIEKTTELVLYAKKVTTEERKNLRVLFKGDVVGEVAYTNSANPEENVGKQG